MEIDPRAKTRITESKPDPFVGRTIDGYRVDSLIGRGGMGAVYKATQLSLNRAVAVKILPKSLAQDSHFYERFEREADVLSRLAHPNIVTVFDRGAVDGCPYLVMEYVEGTNLREVLREGPLPPAEALKMLSSLLAALDHAHRGGIVHRDIKPENILLAKGGVPKVADFGLSRMLGPQEATRLTRTHLVLGTYEYMAPEQRELAKEADERSDLYAAGVVLYEMLLGELPIGRFELPSQARPDECDRRIDVILERSLNKDPEQRFQRASEMAEAVSAVLERPEPVRAAEEPPPPPRRAPYKPMRFESHIDNVATIDTALGTICYVAGFAALFGLVRKWQPWPAFLLFFIAGWYLRETGEQLRKYRPSARSAQAVIAVACCLSVVLFVFGYYALWVLFSHRGRTYYQARGAGMNEKQAGRHTRTMIEEPYGQAPPQPPPPRPQPPTPSQIPVQSIVTSEVEEQPVRKRRVSPLIRTGFLILGCSVLGAVVLALMKWSFHPSLVWVPIGGALLVFLGLLQTVLRTFRR